MNKNSTTEMKRHYKMYKAGSKWMTAAIITFGTSLIVLGGTATQSVAADTTTTPTEKTSQTAQSTSAQSQPAAQTTTSQATASDATSSATQTAAANSAKSSTAQTQAAPAQNTQSSASQPQAATQQASSATAKTTAPASGATTQTNTSSVASQATTSTATTATSQASAAATATSTATADNQSQASSAATTDPGPANQDTLTKGNVKGLWDEGYQGQGMVVAVIDSGVQPHADLRLSDDSTATLTKEKAEAAIAKLGYGTYVNSKIPFAYDYVNNDSVNTGTTVAGSTHGEHVAGIIAANGTTADGATGKEKASTYVKGVAPEAQILAMQVIDEFPDENANDISRAIRDAVALGANAIQMSLGIGVTEQDLTDEEQAAVQYATEHGVFVSISAGNNAIAGSIIGSKTPNDISTAYAPKNDSTIGDPGAAASAMTVAAETSATGADSQMDGFSSWGPMADYTLKPDISAPGDNVTSTAIDPATNTQTYAVESGTSMAGPFNAGAALLVMQKIKATQPDLTGADLVKAVKLALMNAAEPMKDINYPDTYISPRRQGAGQIDVAKAGDLTVTAEGSNDAGSVSLGKIGKTTTFTVTLTNHGKTAQNYTVDTNGGPLTQVRDASNGNTVHDETLVGATVNTDTANFTLAAGETKKVTFKLSLDDSVAANQLVEGYLTFKATDAAQTISVPYLGYYGDLTDEQVIDAPANSGESIFNGGYLVDNNNNPLGVTDAASLSNLVNTDTTGKYTWTLVPTYVDNKKVSFSPNGDGASDTVFPYVFSKQNLKSVTIQILDAQGHVVRILDKENNTSKSYLQNGNSFNSDLGLSTDMRLDPNAFTWDGKVYDQATGKYVTAPDGKYTYRLVTEQYNTGAQQNQDYDLPVTVDTVAPTLTGLSYQDGRVSVHYDDQGAGFTKFSDLALKIGNKAYGVNLNNNGQNNDGTLSFELTAAQKAALENSDGSLTLTLTDVAGNKTSASLQATAGTHQTDTTTPTSDVAPQFTWKVGDGPHNFWRSEGFVQAVSDQTSFTAYAQVPAGVDWIVYATDAQTGKVFPGTVDTKTGTVTFNLTESAPYGDFVGTVLSPTADFGTYEEAGRADGDEMIVFLDANGTAGYGHFSQKNVHVVVPLQDNAKAAANATKTSGAPVLGGRAFSQITTHAQPTAGLKFDKFNDNSFTLVGADQVADIYNAQTGQLTITGHVDNPAGKTLTVTDATEPAKTVAIGADGKFSFTVPFKAAEQQSVGYRLTEPATDGSKSTKTAYGELQIYLDTIFPTLDLPQADTLKVDDQGNYDITTTSDTFTVSGTVNDNINGYRLYTNGDNVVHQKNLAGFNNHLDPQSTTSNPYGAADFNQTYTLKDGDNYFTVTAVDMVGNKVTKVFHVVKVKTPTPTPGDNGNTSGTDNSGNGNPNQQGTGGNAGNQGGNAGNQGNNGGTQGGNGSGQTPATGNGTPTTPTTGTGTNGGNGNNRQQSPELVTLDNKLKDQTKTPAAKNGTTANGTKQAATGKTMPQAGESQSPLAVIGLAIVSIFSFMGFASRKKRV
ncbi:S8 family serine peptidase [Lacticaseibacillus zeae]|uniref:S8 family serine peptidase n=1 Tax=Lacticaseibacillus zeae subsp. silagei TaxID=3068307 RepID=A0ABD7Z8C7_LACZE|nr:MULTISPECIES: S8 family serine peptidase [Lacticaseibacillus]MDE3316632.1 S8 family serine peptidase [Lacticaseibacillus zeae]OFR97212.1 peptidase S8 [Lactobacillus sp. HMSC068F07]WLV83424.1 S8 family serine peptidase [Lacticaseibacillus sp. NCIMB 15475]WLV86173.1 S8 family serine peptidase [Lacticaseibacillus sp. NCIMB 15474]